MNRPMVIFMHELINVNDIIYKYTYIANYYVNIFGDVISVDYSDSYTIKKIYWINHDISELGYHRVPLKILPGIEQKFLVHRLVYAIWTEEDITNLVIDHLDNNPNNNELSNLRATSQSGNINRALLEGNFGGNHNKYIMIQDIHSGEVLRFNSLKQMNIFLGYGENYDKGAKSTLTKKFTDKYIILDKGY